MACSAAHFAGLPQVKRRAGRGQRPASAELE